MSVVVWLAMEERCCAVPGGGVVVELQGRLNDSFLDDNALSGQSAGQSDRVGITTGQSSGQSDRVDIVAIIDVSVFADDDSSTRHSAVNHSQTPAAAGGHVTPSLVALPSYSASVSSRPCLPSTCPPIMPHQRSTSLRRHHKLCAECCLHCVVMVTSVRVLLVVLMLVGVGCMAAGITLGALNMTVGHNYFTLSIVFVGQSVCQSGCHIEYSCRCV